MKNLLSKSAVLLSACALCACSSVAVKTDYDHTAHFTKYKTYTLAPAAEGQKLEPSGEAALSDSLRTQLAARSIKEESKGKADLDVVPTVFLAQRVSVHQYRSWGYGSRWPSRYGRYGMWAGAPVVYTDVTHYTNGTLILDFVDAHTQKVVFRGTGTAVVGSSGKNADNIKQAVQKIVTEMPR